ncbi:MAG: CRTAC1 family protein [Acidobacteriota bacterium]
MTTTSRSPEHPSFFRRHATAIVALVALGCLYGFTRLPQLDTTERAELAARFDFEQMTLPAVEMETPRIVRRVHPDFDHISSWISATGAAVAFADLDDDGLPNDLCHVDPRSNLVTLAPAPGTGDRFGLVALDPAPIAFDHDTMAPIGCVPGDFDENGRLDLLVYYWGRTPIAFLRGDAPVDTPDAWRAVDLVPGGAIWHTNGVTQADVDGDGHLDLVITNYFADGTSVLDTKGHVEMHSSMSRATNGGINRILRWSEIVDEGGLPTPRYEDLDDVFSADVAGGWTLAVGAIDLDGDLLPEIFMANDFGPDRLMHNRSRPGEIELVLVEGERTFDMPTSKILGRDSFKGMGVDFGDLNGDGLVDIYVSNIAQEFALEESHHAYLHTGEVDAMARRNVAPFRDHSEPMGLSRSAFSWEARVGDFDNDGTLETMQATGFVRGEIDRWPELQELAMGNDDLLSDPASWPRFQPGDDLSGRFHNPFFVRSASGRYFDLAPDLGIDRAQVSRGIATADIDADGDLDFAVANQWDDSFLYRNDQSSERAGLVLNLLLPTADAPATTTRQLSADEAAIGRAAIGARAVIRLPDGRVLQGQVDGGNGHSGVRAPELHFGLGELDASTQLEVELAWRDRSGAIREETLEVIPGRHVVLLASS